MSSPLHAIDEDRPDRPPERKKPPPRPSQPTFACSAKSDYEPYLSVRSPLRLPGGYSFEAELDGQRVVATVPAGGVEEGETFDVPLPVESTDADGRPVLRSWGEWRDGLCDCCDVGPVHPALWYSICCRLVLLGQIQSRLNLSWTGGSKSASGRTSTCITWLWVSIASYIIISILTFIQAALAGKKIADEETGHATLEMQAGLAVVNAASSAFAMGFVVLSVIALSRTRKRIRHKYSIQEGEACVGCEDVCLSLWCSCCAVGQMARHTADYEKYPGSWCSETGLPPKALPSDEMVELTARRGSDKASEIV